MNDEKKMSVRVKALREQLVMSQERFGWLLGVGFSVVWRWEAGTAMPNKIYCVLIQTLEHTSEKVELADLIHSHEHRGDLFVWFKILEAIYGKE